MNEDKFIGKADIYEKYRPSYPNEFIDYLYSEVGINRDSVIADVGAGTGKFTELLLQRNSFVYGVEPNEEMRDLAKSVLSQYRNFRSVNSSAEDIELPSKTIDFITVAQAFHWFDRAKFKSECRRLLKDGGKVILVWNIRDSKSELIKENYLINQKYCPNFKGFTNGINQDVPEDYSHFFKNCICEYREFSHDLKFNEDSFIGRNLSSSYAPKNDDNNYKPYILSLKKLFQKYNDSGYIYVPNITRSYVGEV